MPIYTYTTFDDPSSPNVTNALGINSAGQIVGYYNNASGFHGFLLSGGAENQSILIRIFNSLDNRSTTYGCSILTLQLF